MPPIYKVWITPLSLVSFDGRAVDIVASEMAQKVLRQQCYNELLEAFRETVGFDVELNFITEAQASAESSEDSEEELLEGWSSWLAELEESGPASVESR